MNEEVLLSNKTNICLGDCMVCPQDICPVCEWEGLNYDRDYPDAVYAVCPQCNWRSFDHFKRDE